MGRVDLADGVAAGAKVQAAAGRFWRELRASEDCGVLEGLRDTLDQGKQQYLAAARRVVAKQTDRLIELVLPAIEARNAAKLASLSVPYKAELADAMAGVLRSVYLEGKASVGRERRVKTERAAPASLALIDPELMAEDFLAAKARSAANILATRLLGALTWEALDQIKDGRIEGSSLQSVMEALSDRNLADMANTSIPEASSLGRRDAVAEIADEIDHAEYSAILDENVCDVCRSLDGLEVKLDDARYERFMPPNPECLGGNRCRCVWVLVFKGEADVSPKGEADVSPKGEAGGSPKGEAGGSPKGESKAVVGPEPRESAAGAGARQPDRGTGEPRWSASQVARSDVRQVGELGDQLWESVGSRSGVREVHLSVERQGHIEKHRREFDVERAVQMLPSVLADPLVVWEGRRGNTVVFGADWDEQHYLLVVVKVLSRRHENWIQSVYMDSRRTWDANMRNHNLASLYRRQR